ncbi:glycosyltransferase family 4 protein [Niallia sp. HCP3S3_B10]|uniref:glycosyltransferase family 4 protein n=1 Tax=Niallia sp. HCP3S3_B10 TaxID=3438944 RepID=UPI003F8AB25B
MKNFGIFMNGPIKEKAGGPSGYLSNLLRGLNNSEVKVFSWGKVKTDNNTSNSRINNMFLEELKYLLHFLIGKKRKAIKVNGNFRTTNVLHVHSVEDLFLLKRQLRYKGQVILTPHRPEPLSNEIISSLQIKYDTSYNFPILKLFLRKIEKFAYKNADGFIFPSEEAEEIYYEFPGYNKRSKNIPFKYLYSGVDYLIPTIKKDEYKKNVLGINSNQKILTYIGRHNFVKGYDVLIESFEEIKKMGFMVVCAGNDDGLVHPIDNNWIELGRINDVENLINSSDIVLLPNRNTYFDLVALEIMAQGKILIASNTGGNKTLSRLSEGVTLFKNANTKDMIEKIRFVNELTKGTISEYEKSNRRFYENNCTLEKFGEGYIKIINEILNEI